jgi:hypothetical protein
MEGGNSFTFTVNIDVRSKSCEAPFIPAASLSDLMTKDIILDSTASKYFIRKFTLTNSDLTCDASANTGAISPASAALKLIKNNGYTYIVAPNDFSML